MWPAASMAGQPTSLLWCTACSLRAHCPRLCEMVKQCLKPESLLYMCPQCRETLLDACCVSAWGPTKLQPISLSHL